MSYMSYIMAAGVALMGRICTIICIIDYYLLCNKANCNSIRFDHIFCI